MIRVLIIAATASAVIAGASLFAVVRLGPRSKSTALVPDQGWDGTIIPDFTLVDQNGRVIDQTVFEGEVTILDFIFTSCPLQCPAMTSVLVGMSNRTVGSGLRFVSMSIDPVRDTPERFAAYAETFGIDESRWLLLTEPLAEAEKADIARTMLRDEIGYFVSDLDDEEPIELSGGDTMPNIAHPGKLFLIGPKREVLGAYDYNRPEQIEMLVARARDAAQSVGRSRR